MDVYAEWAMPPMLAMLVVAGSLLALGLGVYAGAVRARRRSLLAATAEASVGDEPPPLVEGLDVVLSGIVRHHEDHDVAVKVAITQSGSESESSGSWSHSWIEIDREIILAPFLLELASGQLVLVEPPKNVDVADALDQKVWIDRNKRVLSAELVPGEQIFARGRLERSDRAAPGGVYRDVQWGWALRPTDGQMLLSSEPLGAGLRKRADFHRRNAYWALVLLLVTQVSLVWFYSRLAATTELMTVENKRYYYSTDSEGDVTHHHKIELRGAEVEVDDEDYNDIEEGMQLPVRIASTSNWNLGASATLRWWHGAIVGVIPFVFWFGYRGRRRATRPWFRRNVNEDGIGRLPDPPEQPA
jgi:hypothetical protein